MVAERSRLYACANRSCPQYQVQVTVWGQLVSVRFYSWPTLTCTSCGLPPRTVEDRPVAVDVPAKPAKKAPARR